MIDFLTDIEECLNTLNRGGVVLYPTDTIWGLGCDATNADAVTRLMSIKGKPQNKGLITLLANERDVLQYVAGLDLQVFDYLSTIDKPVTVIYQHGVGVADDVLNEDGSLAIRLVKEEFCRHLLKRFKKPIVSTSANIHGQPSPQTFKDVSTEIKANVNYIVNFRREETVAGRASTIIKWEKGAPIIIRE